MLGTMSDQQHTIPSGSPIWIDLMTGGFARQQEFYEALFGWTFEDQGEEFGHYRMIRAGAATVAGAMDVEQMPAGPDGAAAEGPAVWSVYLRSDDIDATMALVQEHGGTVHMEPVDVGTLGRMAVAVTPGGEYVGFWQPGEFSGHDLPLAPGTSVWFEVVSKDFSADAGFYRAVCGWDVVPMGAEGQDDDGAGSGDEPAVDGESPGYATNGAGEAATAGLCDAAQWLPDDVPSHWRVYFRTTEMAGSVRTLEEHGGRVVDGPMDSPFGVVATALDPAGATFQLIQTPEG